MKYPFPASLPRDSLRQRKEKKKERKKENLHDARKLGSASNCPSGSGTILEICMIASRKGFAAEIVAPFLASLCITHATSPL